MFTVTLKPRPSRRWWQFRLARWPRVVAVFSYRYDAHLVPDLIANIEPMVDGWIAHDDRASTVPVSHEPQRRRRLVEAARATGAAWVLGVDPDERFEQALAERMPELTSARGPVAWGFYLREMYSPTRYRVDGVWGKKSQHRLFPLLDKQVFSEGAFHAPWCPLGYKLRHSGLNLYHLKMITRERRELRRNLYKHVDPERKLQTIGYDYLADDEGAVFEEIPAGREYSPPHVEDNGLWMAPIASV